MTNGTKKKVVESHGRVGERSHMESLAYYLFTALPEPVLIVALVVVCACSSVISSSYMDKIQVLRKAVRLVFDWWSKLIFPVGKGHDAVFLSVYLVWVIVIALIMALIGWRLNKIPTSILWGLACSFLGVSVSVTVDTIMSTADGDNLARMEEANRNVVLRRVFLHGLAGCWMAFLSAAATRVVPHGKDY
jgi:hypothetical protein